MRLQIEEGRTAADDAETAALALRAAARRGHEGRRRHPRGTGLVSRAARDHPDAQIRLGNGFH